MADHEDYLPGETPSPHKTTHQDEGADEITVEGLAGELAAEQKSAWAKVSGKPVTFTPSAHKLSHQNGGADKISVAGLLGETAELTTHKALPTIHQDAPNLIETHRLVAGAHHGRYTDAEVRVLASPISLSAPSFFPSRDDQDWTNFGTMLRNRVILTVQYFYAPITFLNSVTVTKMTLYGYRDDALSSMGLTIYRIDSVGVPVILASLAADWIDGNGSKADITINNALIDTTAYSYYARLYFIPNDDVLDVRFYRADIEFTG